MFFTCIWNGAHTTLYCTALVPGFLSPVPKPRGCGEVALCRVAASSLRERGQSTPRSPKQSLSLSRVCLKIAAWPHPGAVGEAALLFFFLGGYFKNPHWHRCLPCPSLLWARTRECTYGCFSPLPISHPPQQRNQGRTPPGYHGSAPTGDFTRSGGPREVTNCRVLSTRERVGTPWKDGRDFLPSRWEIKNIPASGD